MVDSGQRGVQAVRDSTVKVRPNSIGYAVGYALEHAPTMRASNRLVKWRDSCVRARVKEKGRARVGAR